MGKHSHHEGDSVKDSKSDHKHKHHSKHKHNRDDHHHHASVPNQISEDDYFMKNEEFRVWLNLSKRISFENLDSEEAHKLFKESFVRKFNSGSLDSMYYSGIPDEVRKANIGTLHKWKFKITESEHDKISSIVDKVNTSTRHQLEGSWKHMKSDVPICIDATGSTTGARATLSEAVPHMAQGMGSNYKNNSNNNTGYSVSNQTDRVLAVENKREAERAAERRRSKELLDEFSVPKDSREAQLDRRRTVGDRLHGAARDKESNQDGLDIPESVTMGGGGDDDFQSAKNRQKAGVDRREQQKHERIRELQVKEKQRESDFLSKLNIDFAKGERIKIAPR